MSVRRAAWLLLALPTLAVACPPLLNHRLPGLMGGDIDLCRYQGKAVLVVNTASQCGFTPQLSALQALWRQYRARGAVVIGVPSDDFYQELDDDKAVASFCAANYGVDFPMAARQHVRGGDAHPLFRALAAASGSSVKWNFYKYLIAADGKTVTAFSPLTAPDDAAFQRAWLAALPR